MKHHWRDFEVFDEDPREKLEVSNDMGLCALWDKSCAHRAKNVWRASQSALAKSFVAEAQMAQIDTVDPLIRDQITDYARSRFCVRALERAINS